MLGKFISGMLFEELDGMDLKVYRLHVFYVSTFKAVHRGTAITCLCLYVHTNVLTGFLL